jgi:hypothetical protein
MGLGGFRTFCKKKARCGLAAAITVITCPCAYAAAPSRSARTGQNRAEHRPPWDSRAETACVALESAGAGAA